MSLKERLNADLKESMKKKDKIKKSVITMVRAAIKQYEIDNRKELDDNGIIDIISKQIKMRKDALDDYNKANRTDLIEESEKEIEALKEYLPEQLSEEELNSIVKTAIEETEAKTLKDMGKIMSKVIPQTKGKADGRVVKELVEKGLKNLA